MHLFYSAVLSEAGGSGPLLTEMCCGKQVALEVPGWFRLVPVEAIEKTGSGVMQRILNRMVPRFLKQLQADYELWASGDESRKPIAAGELSAGAPISDS